MALNPPIRDWQGRTAWIIGASTGIGRALAAALHARGARIVVSARRLELLREFEIDHPGSLALPLDVQRRAHVREAVATVAARLGRIDLCVYCAGSYQPMRAQDFQLERALHQLDINLVGALHLLEPLLPQLRRQGRAGHGGHLSLVSSVAGYRGLPLALAYGPGKAALIHLAETLYLDLAPEGLGVSLVNPGFVDTPLTAGNDFEMPALISATEAAEAMLAGWARGRFEIHFPRRFTLLLKLLRLLPYGLYFRAVRRATRP